jgi:hypothetical protein
MQDRPMRDPAQILDQVLREADALIHRRLTERGLEFPHLVVAVIPDGPVIWHGNVSPDGLLSFVEELIDVNSDFEMPPAANDTTR